MAPPQPHAWPSAVLIDELQVGAFQGGLYREQVVPGGSLPARIEPNDRVAVTPRPTPCGQTRGKFRRPRWPTASPSFETLIPAYAATTHPRFRPITLRTLSRAFPQSLSSVPDSLVV
jgi:hypothetical protein